MRIFRLTMILAAAVSLIYGSAVFAEIRRDVEMVPSSIVSMAETGDVALIVEKSTQNLYLYTHNGHYVKDMELKCSTGKLAGRKNKSGDRKTPLGVYFFTGKYFEKDLSPIYGTLALPVDYPNQIDKEAGRTGYSIWLHGTDKELKPRDSNGCVALGNNDLERIEKRISLDYTPIIFLDKINYINKNETTKVEAEIYKLLRAWCTAFKSGTYHNYLACYSPAYLPDIGWWRRWHKLKQANCIDFSVELRKKSIYKDGGLYVVLMEEVLGYRKTNRRTGVKKLYISHEKGEYKIRGESYKFIHYAGDKGKKKKNVQPPLLAAATQLVESVKLEEIKKTNGLIKSLVAKWARTWSDGDIAAYADFYSNNFYSSGMDKKTWVDKKSYLDKLYSYIDVSVSNVTIENGGNKVFVNFQQKYKSSGYSALGSKTLVLVNEDKQWKIIQEIWKKS